MHRFLDPRYPLPSSAGEGRDVRRTIVPYERCLYELSARQLDDGGSP